MYEKVTIKVTAFQQRMDIHYKNLLVLKML